MSKNNKQSVPSLSFEGFRGVDGTACGEDPPRASDVVNFRIRKDGSLEKRCGYRLLTSVDETIRAMWTGMERGSFLGYLLLGNTLYSLDFSTGDRRALGTVDTSEGKACIFFYSGYLYVMDKTGFYRFQNGTLSRPLGYVPLIGKDWPNNTIGETYEPRNILNPHARISYLISDPPSIFLCVEDEIQSVQAVYVNGILQSLDNYTVDADFNTVNVSGLNAGDRVVVYLTLKTDYSDLLSALYSSPEVILFGDANNNRLFFWGGSEGNTIFCSSFVRNDQLKESRKHFPESDGLYFPEEFEFQVGSGQCNVMGAVRHYDRLLLFTEGETWMASSDASGLEEFPAVCVNSELGCGPQGGVILAGNDPISIGRSGIWQWSGDTEELNHRNARCISREIEDRLSREDYFCATLFYDRAEDAIWLNCPSSGDVWVYTLSEKNWTRFSRIDADRFLEIDGAVGFLRGTGFYVFDPAYTSDYYTETDIREIRGEYESTVSDFGDGRIKNASYALLRGDLDGGNVEIRVQGNNIPAASCVFSEPNGNRHSILSKRLPTGRFRHATVHLTAPGAQRQIIHSLSLHCRP
ncbi:MAG: hypothetical protein IJY47_00240 [Clostridia bacterium]|nr:hypothetical protein [Clostridia bacterium]